MVSWLEHLARERSVGHFPLVEEWHDVGSLEAYRELGDLPVD
jgi:NDP-sugar pyrophosphorylase family protein